MKMLNGKCNRTSAEPARRAGYRHSMGLPPCMGNCAVSAQSIERILLSRNYMAFQMPIMAIWGPFGTPGHAFASCSAVSCSRSPGRRTSPTQHGTSGTQADNNTCLILPSPRTIDHLSIGQFRSALPHRLRVPRVVAARGERQKRS